VTDDYPKFKTFSDKHFKITDIVADLDEIDADNPEVNHYVAETSEGKEVKIKPRKEVKRKQKRERDGDQIKTQSSETTKYTLDGAPEIFSAINKAAQALGKVKVKANVTRITYEDGNTSYQVNTRDTDSLEIVDQDALEFLSDDEDDTEETGEEEDADPEGEPEL